MHIRASKYYFSRRMDLYNRRHYGNGSLHHFQAARQKGNAGNQHYVAAATLLERLWQRPANATNATASATKQGGARSSSCAGQEYRRSQYHAATYSEPDNGVKPN